MAEEYLTAKELSTRIKYPVGSIKNLVCQKVFIKNKHYVKPTPRKLLFIWSACEAWLFRDTASTPFSYKDFRENKQFDMLNINQLPKSKIRIKV